MEKIFDRAAGGLKVRHVEALLLSLASANIIEVQRVHNVDRWNVTIRVVLIHLRLLIDSVVTLKFFGIKS